MVTEDHFIGYFNSTLRFTLWYIKKINWILALPITLFAIVTIKSELSSYLIDYTNPDNHTCDYSFGNGLCTKSWEYYGNGWYKHKGHKDGYVHEDRLYELSTSHGN